MLHFIFEHILREKPNRYAYVDVSLNVKYNLKKKLNVIFFTYNLEMKIS